MNNACFPPRVPLWKKVSEFNVSSQISLKSTSSLRAKRSNPAFKQSLVRKDYFLKSCFKAGLLRFARNDSVYSSIRGDTSARNDSVYSSKVSVHNSARNDVVYLRKVRKDTLARYETAY